MKNNPKVCVLMPVYNGATTIELALKSLLAQTYTNWICVIVNDGSKDGTKEILDSLKDTRFKVYHLPKNRGRGYARQFALEHAEGDYLTYLDADDFYHVNKIEVQVRAMMKDVSLNLVATEVLVYAENLEVVGKRVKKSNLKTYYKLGDCLPISMPTAMIKLRRACEISYNEKLDAGEDLDFLSRYLDEGYYMHIPYPYYFYYVSNKNTPYKKILHYTAHDIKRGFYMFKGNARKAALKVIIKGMMKWSGYALLLPILGESFFLKRRNSPISLEEKDMYEKQLAYINKVEI